MNNHSSRQDVHIKKVMNVFIIPHTNMCCRYLLQVPTLGLQIREVILQLFFSYFSMKTYCGYSLEAPHKGDLNGYP